MTFLAAATLLASLVPAHSQVPTTEEITRSLRPSNAGGTRGIREIAPTAPAAQPPAAQPAPYTPAPYTPAPYTPTPYTPAVTSPPPPSRPRMSAGVAAAVPRVVPPTPTHTAQAPAINLTVTFLSGSADLSPTAHLTLDNLGRALASASLSAYRFRIEGHTDTVGAPEMNKTLSERRAAAVVEYLAAKWKIDRTKVEAVGMGQENLVVPTAPNVAEPRNRRVTVINLGA